MNNNTIKDPSIKPLVFGRDGIHTFGFTARCTAGFWVRSRLNSTPWDSKVVYHLIGPMAPPDVSVVDRGFISKQSDNIGVIPCVRNTNDPDIPELRIYGTVDMDTVGFIVCKSGYYTHVDCDEILSLDATVIYANDKEYSGVFKISHIGCERDSGAPVFPFAEDILPGILITGMLTSGSIAEGICVAIPIAMLIP
ncbi:hypothetical protein C2G38_2042936 [Gigaspora rosea]|uniref:Peptidase S1 domain-containing protein n=1 Tax=Gigaspora rosea TaxID=44941 RepID=A0A397UPD4_9GLOM|nr:hypothetical protein C2G38_2042936 [Gigaspora rosea]